LTEPRYYRAGSSSLGRPPRRGRQSRSLWRAVILVAGCVALVVVVLAAVPWFGHLGLPWPGGGTASGPGVPVAGVPAIRVDASDHTRHHGRILVRFTTSDGQPATGEWRVDGGSWHKGSIAYVRAPADHANDGAHVMEVRAVGSAKVAKYTLQVDTTPPDITWLKVRPTRISAAVTVTAKYDVPLGEGVKVRWSVVDSLGQKVGEQGSPHAAAGTETVTWPAATDSGGPLFPGTYRFVLTASDAAGNEASSTASIASDAPVKATLIDDVPKAGKLVALTFDGGSGFAWRHIMRALAKLDAKGTFFCTGISINKYPEVAREAIALGMGIGNHSYDHPDFATISYREARHQLRDNADAWWKACRTSPAPFFRPPYGSYNDTTLKAAGSVGYPFVVNWDVDTGDWTGVSPAEIARRAVDGARPGSIICMHTEWNTQKAIPAMVKGLRAKGLEPVNLDRLFQAGGLL
jgi:peptidoglycan/xylan/chitin deacetylase (PgdA/CDA1 family)